MNSELRKYQMVIIAEALRQVYHNMAVGEKPDTPEEFRERLDNIMAEEMAKTHP